MPEEYEEIEDYENLLSLYIKLFTIAGEIVLYVITEQSV